MSVVVSGIPTEYKSIKVEGAGSSEVNGIYKYGGIHRTREKAIEKPWFSKTGDWNGNTCKFFIYRSPSETWCITVDDVGTPIESSSFFSGNIIYFSQDSGGDSAPTSGWTIFTGIDPPPQVATQEEDQCPLTSSATRENDESPLVRGNDNRESSSETKFSIDVEGARKFGANGNYKYGGNITHAGPWYSKSGEWEGENRNFFISRYSCCWYMSVGSDGLHVPWTGNSLNGRILYFSPPDNGNNHNFPPTSQWKHKMFDSTTPLPRITVRKDDLPQSTHGQAHVENLSVRGKTRLEPSSLSSSNPIIMNEAVVATDGKKRKISTVVVDVMALEAAQKCKQVLVRQKERLRKDIEETKKRLERLKREEEQRLQRLEREETEVNRELQEAEDRLSRVERSKDVISIEE